MSFPYVYHAGWNAAEYPCSGTLVAGGTYNWFLTGGYYFPDASGTVNGIYFSSAAKTLASIFEGLSATTFSGSFDAQQDQYRFQIHGGGSFSLFVSGNTNFVFGLVDVSTRTIHTSSGKPGFIWRPTVTGRSGDRLPFEPEALGEAVFSSDGSRMFVLEQSNTRQTNEWTHENEPRENVRSAYSSSFSYPFPYERFVKHVRSSLPFLAFTGSLSASWTTKEAIYQALPEMAHFQVKRVRDTYDGKLNCPFQVFIYRET